MTDSKPAYLGDGLYATHDGYQFWLIANDPESGQRVALEQDVLHSFLAYVQRVTGAKITIEYPPAPLPSATPANTSSEPTQKLP